MSNNSKIVIKNLAKYIAKYYKEPDLNKKYTYGSKPISK